MRLISWSRWYIAIKMAAECPVVVACRYPIARAVSIRSRIAMNSGITAGNTFGSVIVAVDESVGSSA